MMKRKFLLSVTALALCAALLAGCGGSSSSTASSAQSMAPASSADAGSGARTAENGTVDLDACLWAPA